MRFMPLATKLFPIVLSASCMFTAVPITAAERVSLIQSVEAAFTYNPELKASQEKQQMSRYAVDRAKAGYLPNIMVYGGAGASQLSDSTTRAYEEQHDIRSFADAGVRLTQPIWHGGETMSEVAAREAQFASSDSLLEDKGSSLAFDAIVAHIEVLRRTELVRLARENVKQHAEILRTVRQRYSTNIATVGELHQVESRHSRAKATLSAYESGLDAVNANYLRITGKRPGALTPAPAPDLSYADIDAVRVVCLAKNSRIKAAISDVEASIGERGMAESRYYPRLDLEFGPNWGDRDSRGPTRVESLEAALRLRWDLFSGGADVANVRMSNAKIRQTRQNLHALMNMLDEDIEATYSRWLSSEVQVKDYTEAKKSSRLARDDYYRQFLSAQRSLIDVLDAENDYFYAASQEVMSRGDRVIASYRLMTLTGELMPKLHIDVASLRRQTPTTSEDAANLRSAFATPLFTKPESKP